MFGRQHMQRGAGLMPEGTVLDKDKKVRMGGLFGGKKPKPSMSEIMMVIGGGMRDAFAAPGRGGGNFNAAIGGIQGQRQQAQEQQMQQQQEQQRQSVLAQLAGDDPRLQKLAQLDPEGFSKAMMGRSILSPSDELARDQFGYTQQRDSVKDERYVDERDYTRGNDERDFGFRVNEVRRDQSNIDRAFGAGRDDEMHDRANPSSAITINNSPFGGTPKTLSDVPVGTPIPKDMLGGVALPADTVAVRADNGLGFEFIPVPGSETARKNMAKQEAGAGREYGLGSLVRSYTTLKNNNAITSQSATAGENIGALYSGTGIGKIQDAIGGGIGKNENITARNTINGLSMKALMDMISMSDVSAKAMDSDAEMKAWLGAIKDDNYEAAMAKLHALDISFGGGDLMRKMFSEGSIDQDTYQLVTNRAQTDPQTVAMMKKMQRYNGLGESIGSDNLTPDEMSELEQLRRELGE